MMETTEERIRRESEFSRFITPYGFTLKEWDELLHPRGEHGRFVDVGGAPVEARLGYLLAKTGGFSYQVVSQMQPKSGMMVALPGHERVIEHRPSVAEIRAYLDANADVLTQPDDYAGGWLDTESGKVYFDVSVRVETREEADRLSREYKQEAFYDIATGESIYVRAREEKAWQSDVLPQGHDGRRDTGSNRQPVRGLTIGQKVAQAIRLKYNENHDELGRFASGDGWAVPDLPSEAPNGYLNSAEGILSAWMDEHEAGKTFMFDRTDGVEATRTAVRAIESALTRVEDYVTEKDFIIIKIGYTGSDMAHGGPGSVVLGQAYFSRGGELARMVESIEKHGGDSHFFSTGAPDQTITHEIGHALQDKTMLPAIGGVSSKDWGAIVLRNQPEIVRGSSVATALQHETDKLAIIASRVSIYATKNANEFVAETFNGMVHGKKYDDEVMGLYRSLGGREKQR